MSTVLVTGVRGKTGLPLAHRLVRRGVAVRGGTTEPARVSVEGVRPTAFSWDDPAGWSDALDDVDAVFLVRPDRPDAPELVADLCAATAPGTRVVLLSERSADDTGPDGWASRTEAAVRTSGRPWTVLRPSWFMQVLTDPRFFLAEVRDAGTLSFPADGARVAWIDADDIAAVAEAALLDEGHDGSTHELTGPEAVSLPETARLLANATGRPVTHHEPTIEQAVAEMTGFDRELTVLTYERVRAGSFTPVTEDVARVTGRPARSLEDFLAAAEELR